MFSLQKPGRPYFIAEVGQNHQGQVDIAIEYVARFSAAGASAIKFQKRDNRYLFAPEALNAPYNSENAFGQTYGEHRAALELSLADLARVRERCREVGVDFICTPFDPPSLEGLLAIGADGVKVSSFDLGNIPFLHQIADTRLPVILSSGGGGRRHLDRSVEAVRRVHDDVAVLHCVSLYPCEARDLNLLEIRNLATRYHGLTVGLSDHFNGILTGPLASTLGAQVFEKHVTLNRSWKGTDHSFALEPEGFRKFVRDSIRALEMLEVTDGSRGDEPVFQKLGKSVVAARDLRTGEVLGIDSLRGQILKQSGIPIRESFWLLGRTVVKDVNAGEPLSWENVSGHPIDASCEDSS